MTLLSVWLLVILGVAADCGPPVDGGSTGPALPGPPPLTVHRLVGGLKEHGFKLGPAVPGPWDSKNGPAARLVADEVGSVTITSGSCRGATIDVFSSYRATFAYFKLLAPQWGRQHAIDRNTITVGRCGRLSLIIGSL
jgi:hypothetical protein